MRRAVLLRLHPPQRLGDQRPRPAPPSSLCAGARASPQGGQVPAPPCRRGSTPVRRRAAPPGAPPRDRRPPGARGCIPGPCCACRENRVPSPCSRHSSSMRSSSPGEAEPGAQQKAGQREPGLLVLHRQLPAHGPFVQGRPEAAQQRRVPFLPGQAEDALQRLQDGVGGEPVGLRAAGRGEHGRDVSLRRAAGASAVAFGATGAAAGAPRAAPRLLVRAEVEFERPGLRRPRVRRRRRRSAAAPARSSSPPAGPARCRSGPAPSAVRMIVCSGGSAWKASGCRDSDVARPAVGRARVEEQA